MNKIIPDQFSIDELSEIFKSLAHPARIEIVKHLKAVNSCICGEIVNMLPLSQSTVSQHLKQLKKSGLVKGEIEGPKTCYCIDNEVLKKFKDAVTNL